MHAVKGLNLHFSANSSGAISGTAMESLPGVYNPAELRYEDPLNKWAPNGQFIIGSFR